MSNICVINEQEVLGKQFRVYGSVDEPLFLAKDVATWIEHTNVTSMVDMIDENEKRVLEPSKDCLVGDFQANTFYTFLTEDGLYEVLMLSRKPIAKQFKSKVKEILKTLRKTGSYSIKSPVDTIVYSSDPLERSRALTKVLEEERAKQELITKERDDARDLVKDVVQDNTTYTATEIAKDLGLRSAIELNKWLVDIGFMYKHGKSYLPYAEFSKMGLTSHKLYDTGNGFNVKTVKFTNLGKMWIVEKWKELHNTSKDMLFLLEGNKPN